MNPKSNRSPPHAAKKAPVWQPEALAAEDVLKRVPLLKRIVRDVVDTFETRRKRKERLEELTVISRKFCSSEIEETLNSLRREVNDCDRALETYEKETRDLGGIPKDPGRGLVYFYSYRDSRKIFLVWELRDPDILSWHELDESFSDRVPVEMPAGARASGSDFPERD
ncbi:MAG: DUF2203 family protein [Planctomycetes bacterium]|nr:DUF2203 family protein [Planctomycetota bacterium]